MTATLDSTEGRNLVLGFESTVPRRLVHRRSIAEVFLTECISTDIQDTYIIGAQWPRAHPFYESVHNRHDIMLLAETLRQAAIFLAHTRYRVPLTSRFVMQRLRVETSSNALRIGEAPSDVRIDVVVSRILRSHSALKQFTVTLRFTIGDHVVGSGVGIANVMTPAVYDQLRWKSRQHHDIGQAVCSEPITPRAAGRSRPSDVVLSSHPRENVWQLRTDTRHPILFDHPCDHVPGMSVLEAFRQVAHACSDMPDACIDELDVTFVQFTELDEQTLVITRLDAGTTSFVRIALRQAGSDVAHGSVRLSFPKAPSIPPVDHARRIGTEASGHGKYVRSGHDGRSA